MSRDYLDNNIINIGQKTEKKFYCHSISSERPSTYAGIKNSLEMIIMIII